MIIISTINEKKNLFLRYISFFKILFKVDSKLEYTLWAVLAVTEREGETPWTSGSVTGHKPVHYSTQ